MSRWSTMRGKTAHIPVVCNREIQMKGEGKQGRGFLFPFSSGDRHHAWAPQQCMVQGGVLMLSSWSRQPELRECLPAWWEKVGLTASPLAMWGTHSAATLGLLCCLGKSITSAIPCLVCSIRWEQVSSAEHV